MTDQKPNPQDDLREIADVLETDSHYSGSDESKRRARYAATLRAHAAAMDGARPVAWLVSHDDYAEAFKHRGNAERFAVSDMAQSHLGADEEWTISPLYTHPAPPASEVVEAVAEVITDAECDESGESLIQWYEVSMPSGTKLFATPPPQPVSTAELEKALDAHGMAGHQSAIITEQARAEVLRLYALRSTETGR